MSDLERRLEELFMSDSRARRVRTVDVDTRRGSPLAAAAFVGAVALATIAAIVTLSTLRGPSEDTAATPPSASPSATAPATPPEKTNAPSTMVVCGDVTEYVAATASTTGRLTIQPATGSAKTAILSPGTVVSKGVERGGYVCMRIEPGAPYSGFVALVGPGQEGYVDRPPAAVSPDAAHGLVVRSSSEAILRSEADPKPLARFPATFEAAVTGDGRQVAMVRTSQTGQQLVVFDTSQPATQRTLVDYSGSGEFAGKLVWSSADGRSVLVAVHGKPLAQASEAVEFSSLRVVDAGSGQVREIARTTSGLRFEPIVWHASSSTAVAIETGPGGFAVNYVLVRGTTVTRTPFAGETAAYSVRADADGQRVLALGYRAPRSVRWWPFDRFDRQQELNLTPDSDVSVALWRPGTDEVAVYVAPMTKTAQPGARIEIWSLAGQRRVLREGSPPGLMRTDGSAVITTDSVLVDITTGVATSIPGGTIDQVPYLAVKF